MSASAKVLNTLVNLASKEVDAALQSMAAANKALQQETSKAEMLNAYRQDYVDNLGMLMARGIGKEEHRNFHGFLQKLDEAISGQAEVVISAEYELAKAREIWQEAQRKKLSYETLQTRQSMKTHRETLKREQKTIDEFASRAKRSRAA